MKALILSGGTGTRLRPLTFTHAKQLLPLANKPILFYIIDKIVKTGIRDIGVIVGDTHEEIEMAVGNGDRWNVNIKYIHQSHPLGLAHAVKLASKFLGDSDFLMVLGDNIFNLELDILIQNYYLKGANTSILLYKVSDPTEFGVAVVKDNRIVKLVEKPKKFVSDLIITGIYVFDKSIFSAIDKTKPSPRGELEITDAIQKQLEEGGDVTYELIDGWWKDTGKLQDILEANRLVLDGIDIELQTLPYGNSMYTGKIILGKDVIIKNSIIMGPAAIADDSIITNSFIGSYTSISKGVIIDSCEIDNSIILEGTKLYNINKRVSGSLIGKNVLIKGVDKRPFSNSFLIGDNSEIYIYEKI